MKKLMMAGLVCILTTGGLFAQVRQTVKIPVDQVPMSVRNTFEKDFSSNVPTDGYWSVEVETKRDRDRTAAKPLWYTYNKRNKKEKIEIRFSPQGELTSSTGVDKGSNTVSDSPEKKKIG